MYKPSQIGLRLAVLGLCAGWFVPVGVYTAQGVPDWTAQTQTFAWDPFDADASFTETFHPAWAARGSGKSVYSLKAFGDRLYVGSGNTGNDGPTRLVYYDLKSGTFDIDRNFALEDGPRDPSKNAFGSASIRRFDIVDGQLYSVTRDDAPNLYGGDDAFYRFTKHFVRLEQDRNWHAYDLPGAKDGKTILGVTGTDGRIFIGGNPYNIGDGRNNSLPYFATMGETTPGDPTSFGYIPTSPDTPSALRGTGQSGLGVTLRGDVYFASSNLPEAGEPGMMRFDRETQQFTPLFTPGGQMVGGFDTLHPDLLDGRSAPIRNLFAFRDEIFFRAEVEGLHPVFGSLLPNRGLFATTDPSDPSLTRRIAVPGNSARRALTTATGVYVFSEDSVNNTMFVSFSEDGQTFDTLGSFSLSALGAAYVNTEAFDISHGSLWFVGTGDEDTLHQIDLYPNADAPADMTRVEDQHVGPDDGRRSVRTVVSDREVYADLLALTVDVTGDDIIRALEVAVDDGYRVISWDTIGPGTAELRLNLSDGSQTVSQMFRVQSTVAPIPEPTTGALLLPVLMLIQCRAQRRVQS